jgi:catalase
VLDPTKIVPEELVPVVPIGRMVLDRNPDNFFAETEQVAFGVQNLVPGIDFSNDPAAARAHPLVLRHAAHPAGRAQLPRDPDQRLAGAGAQQPARRLPPAGDPPRRVSYEPNSLAGGCPFQAGGAGFRSFPQPMEGDKVRGKPEKFAEHFAQATLFWNSQTEYEKATSCAASASSSPRCTVPAIRERTVSMLRNVSDELAEQVAEGIGIALPKPMPRLMKPAKVEVEASPPLSLTARPGDGSVRGMNVAILIAPGIASRSVEAVRKPADGCGRGRAPGRAAAGCGGRLEAEATLETMPSVLFDCGGGCPMASPAPTSSVRSARRWNSSRTSTATPKPILFLGTASPCSRRRASRPTTTRIGRS